MSEVPNLNTGEPWSEFDIRDLVAGIAYGDSVAKLAVRLCRTVSEIRDKARELGRELPAAR